MSFIEQCQYALGAVLFLRAWFMIKRVSFHKLCKDFGFQQRETSKYPVTDRRLEQINLMVLRLARYLPFPCRCLSQAMVAQYFLSKYSLETTLYIGLRKENFREVLWHAWLRCGDVIVTGANGGDYRRFSVYAAFAKGKDLCKLSLS